MALTAPRVGNSVTVTTNLSSNSIDGTIRRVDPVSRMRWHDATLLGDPVRRRVRGLFDWSIVVSTIYDASETYDDSAYVPGTLVAVTTDYGTGSIAWGGSNGIIERVRWNKAIDELLTGDITILCSKGVETYTGV